MTLAVWPDDLPAYFLVDGFSYSFPDGRVRSQPDSGPPKMRRRSSAVVTPVAGGFYGDNSEVLRLLDFYNTDTAGGSLPFWIRDRMLDGSPLRTDDGALLLTDGDSPLLVEAWWLALFDTVPALSAVGGTNYRISFSFNILP